MQTTHPSSSSHSHVSAIAGSVVGGVAVLAIALMVGAFLFFRQRRKKEKSEAGQQVSDPQLLVWGANRLEAQDKDGNREFDLVRQR